MMWMRMAGQRWSGAAASFVAMWVVMMVAMMLPSLTPVLSRFRCAVCDGGDMRGGWLTGLMGAGYFSVWAAFGAAVFLLGSVLAALEMQHPALARAVPIGVGLVVVIAGVVQFTVWKARRLGCCRDAAVDTAATAIDANSAWRHGVHLGVDCLCCCLNLMIILVVVGVMDLTAMALVTAAITVERFEPRIRARIGAVAVAVGVLLIVRAIRLV